MNLPAKRIKGAIGALILVAGAFAIPALMVVVKRHSAPATHQKFYDDVPAIHQWNDWDEFPVRRFDGERMTESQCHTLADWVNEPEGEKGEAKWSDGHCMYRWTFVTCQDKTRFLLTAQDQTHHCVKFSE